MSISIAANKVRGIRAVVGLEQAKMIIDEWLAADFEGVHYSNRVRMIGEIEREGNE